ncbi:MAG: hypothetical protein ACO1RT_11955 [Planctomycetaceae bacterium]
MLKQVTLSLAALLCFASQGFARHPFVNDPISDAPSVLIHTQADAAVQTPAVEADADVAVQGQVSGEINAEGAPAVDASSSVVVESAPVSQPTRVYRYSRPSRRSNGLFGELMELERKKNAWIRRNVFGR